MAEAGGGEGDLSNAMNSSEAWKPDAVGTSVIVDNEERAVPQAPRIDMSGETAEGSRQEAVLAVDVSFSERCWLIYTRSAEARSQ